MDQFKKVRGMADPDGMAIDLLNDPNGDRTQQEIIRISLMKDYNIDFLPIPGDIINHSELGKVKVLKIIGLDIYGGPAEYEIEDSNSKTFPISFDELTDMIGYGEISDVPQTLKNSFDFQLIDTEDLSEARIFRTTNNFKMLKGKDVADLLYLTTLSIYLMYKDDKQYDYARSYARQTVQYGPYTLFRSHATDLYMLAHVCNSNHREKFNFRNNSESQKFLMSTNFANRTHWNIFNKLKSGQLNDTEAHPYLFRLERQLKVNDSRYKQWRRLIMDWENLRYRQRQFVTANILQEYRRRARGTEMIGPLSTMVKYKKYGVSDKFSKKPTNNKGTNLQKFAGTVGGAVAGRYAGKKIAQKTGANVDKYKKVGTGLGAIAGYWAGGRKRQK